MLTLLDTARTAVCTLCATQVSPGRGLAIALTAALLVLAIGQLRSQGPHRPA